MKTARIYGPVALACIAFIVVSCHDRSVSPAEERPIDYASIHTIVYSKHVQPLFDNKCATSGCHDGRTAEEEVVLESWGSLFAGGEHGALIVPYRSEWSHLFFHINRDSTLGPVAALQMPPAAPLSHDEILFVKRWIEEGAKNDDGDVAFSNTPAGKVYATNQAADEVSVIDVASNLLMRMVPVGSLSNLSSPPESPHNVSVDPAGEFYYVNLIVAGEVWKYRVSDNAFIAKLALGTGRSPAQIAISADGTTGFVSNFDLQGNHRSVQVFNTLSMDLAGEISDQRMWATHGATLSRDGKQLWTCNQTSDNLAVIDVQNQTVTDIVKVDATVPDIPSGIAQFGPYQLVFSLNGQFAYVTCRLSNEVRVFSTVTLQRVKTVAVGSQPLILDITPDGKYIYIANRGSGASPSKTVSVIRTSDNTVTATIQDVGVEPHGVAVSKDGKFVYVTCENINNPDAPHHPVAGLSTPGIIAIIDAATNQVIKRIEVGSFAAGIAVTP